MKITERITQLVLARKPSLSVRNVKRDIATTCGISYEAVRQWFAGDTENIKNDNLVALSDGYDTTVDWLLGGKGEPPRRKAAPRAEATSTAAEQVQKMLAKHGKGLPDEARLKIAAAVEESLAEQAVVQADQSNVIVADFSRRALIGDEIRIAHYDVQGAMGNGKQVHDFPELFKDVTVSQQHLRELGVKYEDPRHLKMITGSGQSMAPTIQDKDPMIVDASIREFTGDGIYALVWQGHFYIKSLQIDDEEHFLMVSMDKDLYPPRRIRIDDTYIQARILLVWNAKRV